MPNGVTEQDVERWLKGDFEPFVRTPTRPKPKVGIAPPEVSPWLEAEKPIDTTWQWLQPTPWMEKVIPPAKLADFIPPEGQEMVVEGEKYRIMPDATVWSEKFRDFPVGTYDPDDPQRPIKPIETPVGISPELPPREREWGELPSETQKAIEEGIKEEAEKAKRGELTIPPGRIITIGAREEKESYKIPTEILNKYFPAEVGERLTPGERFIGEWVMPLSAIWWIPAAGAGWRAVAPWVAKGGLPKVAGIAARVGLAPIYAAEKLIGVPIKAISKLFKPKPGTGLRLVAEGEAPSIAERRVFPLPDTEFTVAQVKPPTAAGELPVFKQTLRIIDPTLVSKDAVTVAKTVQGTYRDMAEGYTTLGLSHLDVLISKGAKPKIVNNIVIDPAIKPLANAPKLASGKPSMNAHDIVEFAERYQMPAANREYFNEIRQVSREITGMLENELSNYGIRFRKISGEADFVYLRRVVETVGDIERLGLPHWREMQMSRAYDLAGEATIAKKPVTYLDPEVELRYQLESAYEWITQLRTKEILTGLTTTAKARVPAKVVNYLIEQNDRRVVADKLIGTAKYPGIITRVGRGEKLAPQTLAMVKRKFPKVADDLVKIMGVEKGRVGAATKLKKSFTPTWETARAEFLSAKGVYKARLQRAGKKWDEGLSWYLPGRIFTTQKLAGKEVLGRDIAQMVEKQFGYRRPGAFETVTLKLGRVGAILRQTKAALDLSVQGIQTLPVLGIDVLNLATGKPSAYWAKGAFRGWQRLFDPKRATAWMDRPEVRAIWAEFIPRRALLNRSEYAEATHILGRIPVVGKIYEHTGAAFTVGRQATQTYLLMGERDRALRGLQIGTVAFENRLAELGEWSNVATGVLSTRGIGISATQRATENVLFFAPRYTRAVGSLVLDLAKGGYTGRQAWKAISGLMAAGYAWGTFTPLAMGQKPRLNPLPESMGGDGAKWLTVKVGNAYLGIGSTTFMLARLAGSNVEALLNHPEDLFELSMSNPNVRFLRGKAGPVPALIVDITTGHDFLGELTTDNLGSVAKTFGDWAIPIWVEGMLDAREAGSAPWQYSITGVVEFFGGRTIPETDWDKVKLLRELYAEQDYDLAYKNLRRGDIDRMLKKHPDLAELEETSKAHMVEISSDVERWYYEQRNYIVQERDIALDKAATALLNGQISKRDYDSERGYIRPYYFGSSAILWAAKEHLSPDVVRQIERWIEQNQSYDDKALSAYQEYRAKLIEEGDLPKDWAKIDLALEAYLKQYHTNTQSYIRYQQDTWINDLPDNARRIEELRLQGIANETWWNNYRDMGLRP